MGTPSCEAMGTKRNELDETDDTLGGLAREGVALLGVVVRRQSNLSHAYGARGAPEA